MQSKYPCVLYHMVLLQWRVYDITWFSLEKGASTVACVKLRWIWRTEKVVTLLDFVTQ